MAESSPTAAKKADGQTRTDDRSITSRVLYQLSYTSSLGLSILAFSSLAPQVAGSDGEI